MADRKILMGALPMIVSAIAGGADVRVVWGNFQTASTDGKQIRMPLLPLEDEGVEDYALGYAVHETGHVVGTDFTVPRKPGLAHSLAGILEDVRIEAERMRTLPGARRWLERLAYRLLKDGRLGNADADMSVPNKLVSYLLTHLWYEILDFQGLREAASRCRDNLAQSLPPDVFGALEACAMKVRHARDTAEVVALADELMDVLRSKQEEYQQQAQTPQSQPEDDEENEEQPQGGGQAQPDQQDGGDGDQKHSPPQPALQDGSEDKPNGDGSESSPQPQGEADEDQPGAQAAGGESDGEGVESKDSAPSTESQDQGARAGNAAGEDGTDADESTSGAQAQGAIGGEQNDEPGDEHGTDPAAGQNHGDGDASSSEGAKAQSGDGAGGDTQPGQVAPQQGHQADDAAGAQDERSGGDSPALDPAKVAQALQDLVDAGEPEEGGDIGERIAQGLQESLQQAGANGAGLFTSAPDVHDLTGALGAPGLIGEVRKQSTAIRARLDEFVQAQTRTRSSNAMAGPRLARDAGLRLVTGNMHVYSEPRARARKVDTAFDVFVDCSISMRGRQIQVAREAALALAVALEQVDGVQLAITAFGGRYGTVARVMRFGEDLRRTAGRFNLLEAAGSTPMAEALLVGHSDLLALNAQRRVAVVITDGEPNDTDATQQVIALGEKLGVEHIAIGIGSEARAAQLFAVSRNISDVGELPSALMGMVREQMFTQRLAA